MANSLGAIDAYIHHQTRLSLVQNYGLWPVRRQAITWTNAALLLIKHPEINFSEFLIEIETFS